MVSSIVALALLLALILVVLNGINTHPTMIEENNKIIAQQIREKKFKDEIILIVDDASTRARKIADATGDPYSKGWIDACEHIKSQLVPHLNLTRMR